MLIFRFGTHALGPEWRFPHDFAFDKAHLRLMNATLCAGNIGGEHVKAALPAHIHSTSGILGVLSVARFGASLETGFASLERRVSVDSVHQLYFFVATPLGQGFIFG